MQFCDLNRQYLLYQSEIDSAIKSVIDSSSFINGSEIELLENELSDYVGVKHSLCVSSGTDALLMALIALNLKPDDEVICPAFSFIASASMISFLKAKPVFVDVSPIDYNIDVAKIEKKITSKTKGIIAVSLFGQCANFEAINDIAKKRGLWVIEDGAQSFGASQNGVKSGALTKIGVTSFFPAKPLGCYGDGGAIFTNDDVVATAIKRIRAHGQSSRYYHDSIGINGRMDTIQAAILRVKLKHFDKELKTRQDAAELYSQLLDGLVMLPIVEDNCKSTWAQFTIVSDNRDFLQAELKKKDIPTIVHYPLPLPKQLAFSNLSSYSEEFHVSELLSETVLSLPMHGLITSEEVNLVAQNIIEIINA